MSKKLIEERAILLFPSLAVEIGLNNAIFLQQLHFWCDIADELGYGVEHEGVRWIYKTAQEWRLKDFPFWSVVTIRRIINELHDKELIHAKYLNTDKWNRTLYYRINYQHPLIASDQIDHMEVIKKITSKSSDCVNVTENTTKNTSNNLYTSDFEKFWEIVPNKDSKKQAAQAFKKAIKKIDLDKMIEAYKANIAFCDSIKRFYKAPSTWLNNECWEDESIKPFMSNQQETKEPTKQPKYKVELVEF